MNRLSTEAKEDRARMSSHKGESGAKVSAEGRSDRGEVESKFVTNIAHGGGAASSLDLRQDISGLGSWGFNGQAHGQILAR
jgi:hypothetical protein